MILTRQLTFLPDTLTDRPPPHSGSATSRAAAAYIAPTAKSIRAQVYRYILACGDKGATDYEIARAFGKEENTTRARRWELEKKDRLVRDSGRKRDTASGCEAIVWVAVTDL